MALRIEVLDSSPLNGATMYEKIDVKVLDYLINSDLLKTTFNNPFAQQSYANEKEQLMKYRKLIKNGLAHVKYEKVKSMGGYGRVNPQKSLGLFSIRREIRHTLAKPNYVDLDIENAHPVILLQICKKNHIECKILDDYVKNRANYLNIVMETYNVDRDNAKRLFIRLLYFGSFNNWAKDIGKPEAEPLECILEFKKELQQIGTIIMNNNPDLVKLVEKSKEEKKKTEYNKTGSVVSFYLQEYEFRILQEMYFYLLQKGFIKDNNCVLAADGIMLDKQYYYPELLNELKKIVKTNLDFDLVFTQKDMNQDYLNQIQEDLKRENKIKFQEIEEDSKKIEEEYQIIKEEVEKEYFFISDLGKFAKFYEEDKRLIVMNEKTLLLNLAPHRCHKITKFGKIEIPFTEKWLIDKNRKSFQNIIFDPEYKGNKFFNLFTGLELEDQEYTEKSTANIHKVLDHVLGKHKPYILEWFSFILKYKKKSNIAVVLYSDNHGVGKNSVIELLLKLIDAKYSTKIENIDDLASNFNSYLEGILFCYGDEVLAKNKDLYNFLKNTITRTQVKINRKGIDSYKCDDRTNYIFTTNDPLPFKIEKNDRRISMIHCNEKKLETKYYDQFYKDLGDKDILTSFFNELMDMNTPHKLECLETDIKKDIQDVFTPAPIKYLYSNYRTLEGKKFTNQELFEEIRNFEKEQGYTETKTVNYMTMKIKQVFDFTYKSNDKRGFKFKDLAKHLQTYNPDKFADY